MWISLLIDILATNEQRVISNQHERNENWGKKCMMVIRTRVGRAPRGRIAAIGRVAGHAPPVSRAGRDAARVSNCRPITPLSKVSKIESMYRFLPTRQLIPRGCRSG